jgi:hypothetical protein
MVEYHCQVCLFTTNHKPNYDRHLNTKKHKRITEKEKELNKTKIEPQYVCNKCNDKFTSQRYLTRHRNNTCSVIKYEKDTIEKLKEQLKEQIQEKLEKEKEKEKELDKTIIEPQYICNKCNDKFTSQRYLTRHRNNTCSVIKEEKDTIEKLKEQVEEQKMEKEEWKREKERQIEEKQKQIDLLQSQLIISNTSALQIVNNYFVNNPSIEDIGSQIHISEESMSAAIKGGEEGILCLAYDKFIKTVDITNRSFYSTDQSRNNYVTKTRDGWVKDVKGTYMSSVIRDAIRNQFLEYCETKEQSSGMDFLKEIEFNSKTVDYIYQTIHKKISQRLSPYSVLNTATTHHLVKDIPEE